jgi:uncharacterized protein (TIGR02611 family)
VVPAGIAAVPTLFEPAHNLSAVGQDETGGRPPLIERVRARREQHRERNRLYRIAFAVVGFLVCIAGVVMLVTPGPGILVIIVGLTMLALEFAWAERWLERLIIRAERVVDQVTHGSPARRAALLTAGVLALAAIVVMVVFWDVPFFPG